jgi:adenylosuccinate synthase
MKYFYEKNRELIDSTCNKKFEEVLKMTKEEFREWAISLRKTVVELWDEKGQPPRVGYDEHQIIDQFNDMSTFPVHKFLVKDELTGEMNVIRNTSNIGNAVNQWFPTMMKTRINYTTDVNSGKSIYDYFAKDELLNTFTTYATRHFKRDSFYHYSTPIKLNQVLKAGKRVLLEGSQGTLLDVDHGTYPFVTSSNPTAGGACTGSGIGPTKITRVIGILKAYTTRVGSGPFPTELFDEDGEALRRIGGEIGVTTGRARRCGWFDAPIARYAVRVNGLTDFFLTKLDVLTGWEKIPVCVAYEIDGKRVEELPASQTDFHHAKPIYEYLAGWTEDISNARKLSDLPKNAQDYVAFLEKISGAPMSAIGVGPGRDQTIVVKDFI